MKEKADYTYIPLDKIIPLYNPEVSTAYMRRMKKTYKYLLDVDLMLAVEKDHDTDEYFLVDGYDTYQYMLSHDIKTAPCIIENLSKNKTQQYLKILRRSFNKGDCSKKNRKILLSRPSLYIASLTLIADNTGLTISEIKNNYNYHPTIPKKFINGYTTEKTMNWIERLPLENVVKTFLYERAGLPENNPQRLTHSSSELIGKLLKEHLGFCSLTYNYQLDILEKAILHKSISLEWLKSMTNHYL